MTTKAEPKYPNGTYKWGYAVDPDGNPAFMVEVKRIPETGYAHAYVKGLGQTWCEVNKHDGRPATVELLIDVLGQPMPSAGAMAVSEALSAAASFARKFDRGE